MLHAGLEPEGSSSGARHTWSRDRMAENGLDKHHVTAPWPLLCRQSSVNWQSLPKKEEEAIFSTLPPVVFLGEGDWCLPKAAPAETWMRRMSIDMPLSDIDRIHHHVCP